MSNVLIVGGSRGLGYELALEYGKHADAVFATSRSLQDEQQGIRWISDIDVSEEDAGAKIVKSLKAEKADMKLSTVIITAGYFGKESFDAPDFEAEVKMYKTSAIGPVFIVLALYKAGLLISAADEKTGSKIILVSSESGSITLRHESEGGGNYAHHASKSALNMVGKLLSLDLKKDNIAVGLVHPGFMRTSMTKNVGFAQFWDSGGAVTPKEAALSLTKWIENDFDIEKSGTYWAPRGPGDIGTAEDVLGPKDKLPTPLQLPW